MATYAIGDIQGCDTELGELLARLRFKPDRDRLWFVGDLVNRGPESLQVLRRVRGLGDNAITVLGNHDLHLLALARADSRELRKGDTLQDILDAPDREPLLDWLQARPLLHHDAALGCTLIHAGLPPQWDLDDAQRAAREVEAALRQDAAGLYTHMYGNKPDRWSQDLTGYDRLRFIVNCLTRLRYCTADGHIDLKIKETPQRVAPPFMPWFKVPGRRSAGLRIVCGHWSTLGLYRSEDVNVIDTGCIWGGALTALRLDEAAEPVQLACRAHQAPGE